MGINGLETEKKGIKLSVIVPVYNVEPYIKKCLDSIINQTYSNLEIILVDDGSTDRSGEICDEYALIDSRVQVLHKENGGTTSARKAGIICATGEYATNIDPDDWIEKDAYEYMIGKLEQYDAEMLVLGYKKEHVGFVEEYRQGLVDGFYQKEKFWNAFNDCMEKNNFFCQPIDMSLCNKVIKTEMWKQYQMRCADALHNKNEDDAVIFPCILNMDNVYIDSKCFYHYCVRNNSSSWISWNDEYERFVKLAEHLIWAYNNAQNKDKINSKFLLYKLFYHLMLDIPEKLISNNVCMIYPQIKPRSNIIVYGKGVFASRMMKRINDLRYCNVIDNVDKADINRISMSDIDSYDFVVIAILNFTIVRASIEFLINLGVEREKILCIDKEKLISDLLPNEIKALWSKVL